jgi:hypothetical protein
MSQEISKKIRENGRGSVKFQRLARCVVVRVCYDFCASLLLQKKLHSANVRADFRLGEESATLHLFFLHRCLVLSNLPGFLIQSFHPGSRRGRQLCAFSQKFKKNIELRNMGFKALRTTKSCEGKKSELISAISSIIPLKAYLPPVNDKDLTITATGTVTKASVEEHPV